jgi:hypothetical protein
VYQHRGGDQFPRLARGHGKHCEDQCQAKKQMEARYNNKDEYVDGHYQSQSVAERAHREGYR